MIDNNSYLEAKDDSHIPTMGYFLECSKCKRKILLEMGMIGTPHHFPPTATCADCLEITEEFRQDHTEVAEKIEEWRKT